MIRNFSRVAALAGMIICGAGAAHAGATAYTDFSAWDAVTFNDVNRDFNGYSGEFNDVNGLVDQGVTFSGSGSYLDSLGPGSCGGGCQNGPDLGSGNYLLGPASVFATLSTPTNAVGVDVALLPYSSPRGDYPLQFSVTANFSVGPSQTYQVAVGGPYQRAFFGLTDTDADITSLTISAPNLYPQYYCAPGVCYNGLSGPNLAVDNFRTGSAGVPEPASWALLIAGFGLAGASLRSRRRAVAAV